jgi:hypothetical protein
MPDLTFSNGDLLSLASYYIISYPSRKTRGAKRFGGYKASPGHEAASRMPAKGWGRSSGRTMDSGSVNRGSNPCPQPCNAFKTQPGEPSQIHKSFSLFIYAYFLGKVVETAPFKQNPIQFHNYSTSPCGFGRGHVLTTSQSILF